MSVTRSAEGAASPGAALKQAAERLLSSIGSEALTRLFDRPVFIVSAPRAGSTLLFEQLAARDGAWSIGGESHGVFRVFPELRAEDAQCTSGRLAEAHASDAVRTLLPACFACLLRDHRGTPWLAMDSRERPARLCFIEKTPRNALNVPFLRAVWPGARFIYLQRDAPDNIASLIEAWRHGLQSGRFVTFRDLPGWDREAWCFLLPRGWQALAGQSLAEIAAFQWQAGNDTLLDDLVGVPPGDRLVITYDELVTDSAAALRRACRFAGVDDDLPDRLSLPPSRTVLTAPARDKWLAHRDAIEALLPDLEETSRRMREFAGGG